MKDLIIEEILTDRPRAMPVAMLPREERTLIPPASRYPRSVRRAELEFCRQPWNLHQQLQKPNQSATVVRGVIA